LEKRSYSIFEAKGDSFGEIILPKKSPLKTEVSRRMKIPSLHLVQKKPSLWGSSKPGHESTRVEAENRLDLNINTSGKDQEEK
jgi:hypothetical protein